MPLSQRKGPQALEWWTWVGMGVNVVMMAVISKTGAEPVWCWVFMSSAEEGTSLGVEPSQVGLAVLSYTPPSCTSSLVGIGQGSTFPLWGPVLHPAVA